MHGLQGFQNAEDGEEMGDRDSIVEKEVRTVPWRARKVVAFQRVLGWGGVCQWWCKPWQAPRTGNLGSYFHLSETLRDAISMSDGENPNPVNVDPSAPGDT
jgi:hypothetical protein